MAAVYYGPGDLRLEERPLPVLRDPTDAIVKVSLSTILSLIHISRQKALDHTPKILDFLIV